MHRDSHAGAPQKCAALVGFEKKGTYETSKRTTENLVSLRFGDSGGSNSVVSHRFCSQSRISGDEGFIILLNVLPVVLINPRLAAPR